MIFLIMETHPGYAIVLDNEGRFHKAANMNYQVGQTVSSIVRFTENCPPDKKQSKKKRFIKTVSMAACFCLLVFGSWHYLLSTYGTVRMQINPDVQITVNHFDYVVDVKGLNEDGSQLIAGYAYYFKNIDRVTSDLSSRAIDMGYLKEGGNIRLAVASANSKWKTATQEHLLLVLEKYNTDSITVISIDSEDLKDFDAVDQEDDNSDDGDDDLSDDSGDDWDDDLDDDLDNDSADDWDDISDDDSSDEDN